MKNPANWLIIESVTNIDSDILYLDFSYNKNIINLLEALAKNACNVLFLDKILTSARGKKNSRKDCFIIGWKCSTGWEKKNLGKRCFVIR